MSERKMAVLLLEADLVEMVCEFQHDREQAYTFLMSALAALQGDGLFGFNRADGAVGIDTVAIETPVGFYLRYGCVIDAPPAFSADDAPLPPLPIPVVVEPPPPSPAPEPIPIRPAVAASIPGLPREYPQNIVGQIIHAAGVQIDPLVPLYWHRKEHQIEAVDLVNRSGLSSDEVVARVRAARDRPELRRVSQLADIVGGKRT